MSPKISPIPIIFPPTMLFTPFPPIHKIHQYHPRTQFWFALLMQFGLRRKGIYSFCIHSFCRLCSGIRHDARGNRGHAGSVRQDPGVTSRPRHQKGRGQTRTSHSAGSRRTACVWRGIGGALQTSPLKMEERGLLGEDGWFLSRRGPERKRTFGL